MKIKIFNALLIISSLLGYLEWGQNNKMFLFQAEVEIISKFFINPLSVIHPFTMLPLFGQLLLLITLVQKKTSRIMSFLGIGGIGILIVLMFVIGCLSLNIKILLSTVPFLVIAWFTIRELLKKSSESSVNKIG